MRKFFIALSFLLFGLVGFSQQRDTLIIKAGIFNGDTLMQQELKEVEVFPQLRNRAQTRRYNRLTRYVKKVYPYAQTAALKIKEYEQVLLDTADDPKAQRKIMKHVEDTLKSKEDSTKTRWGRPR